MSTEQPACIGVVPGCPDCRQPGPDHRCRPTCELAARVLADPDAHAAYHRIDKRWGARHVDA